MSEQIKFFQNVQTYVDQAAGFTKLPKGLIEQIKICNAVYQINFPVKITVLFAFVPTITFISKTW